MIAVSDSFKKAIKSDNREIYGYIDVTYDKQDGEYDVTEIPTVSLLSKEDGSDLIDDIKVMKNYATLENNYFLLDGSFILANKNTLQDSGGYISENIFSDMSDKTITVVSSETGYVTTKGFTVFFKDNIPFDFDIDIITNYAEDIEEEDEHIIINVVNNTRHNYQYVFEEEVTIKEFKLTIKTVEFNDRRIRIPDINFSLTDVYQGEELISFEVNEEIDLLVESLPINTCTINLNNYPDENGNVKFDPISPTGMTQYLTENTTIIPYIGVLTEENGIEYVKMGTFYLKEWSSDNDGNVTINSENLMGRIINIDIVSDGTFLMNTKTSSQLATYFSNMTGYEFYFVSGRYSNDVLRHTNLGEWIKAQMPFQIMWLNPSTQKYSKRKFHITRDNVASEDHLNEDVVDSISRKELINDVMYTTKSVIREVNISSGYTGTRTYAGKQDIVNESHTLSDEVEYVWFHFDKFVNRDQATFSYSVISGSGQAELIDANFYMMYIKFTGTVGSVINIVYNGNTFDDPVLKIRKWTNELKSGDILSLDFHEYFESNSEEYLKSSAQYYLTEDKKYVVNGNTIGDPSLETGDTITIQTRYEDENDGYKEMIITKQKFTYDGGLQCEMEGRGN